MYRRARPSYDDEVPEVLGVPLVSGLVLLVIVTLQTLGGVLVWLTARRGPVAASEALGMGFVLGTIVTTLGAQISLFAFGAGWGWLVAPALGLVAWLGSRVGWWSRGSVAGVFWKGVWLLVPALVLGLLALVPSFLLTPLRNGYLVGGSYQPDLVFFEALAQSVATWGPADSSMLVGEPIRYHWLSYGWIGGLTEASGAGSFVVMTRVFPVVMLVASIVLAASWARLLSRVWWVPGLAALLVVAGGYVGAAQGVALTYDSPSTTSAVVIGLASGVLFTLVVRGSSSGSLPVLLVLLGVVSFALVGAKASQALVIAVGVAAVFVWSLFARAFMRVWPLVLASAAGMLVGYLVFLAGVAGDETNIGLSDTQQHASTFQGLDPFTGGLGIALGTAALLLAILPRWIGAAWLRRDWPAEFAFGIGLAVAGVGTLVVLRSGTNAAWFALGSTALLAVLSAAGVGVALTRVGYRFNRPAWRRDPVVWAVVTAVVINVVVLFTYALAAVSGASVLWRGPVLAWTFAVLVAVLLARSALLSGGAWLRWAAMLTAIITVTSVGARANGSIVWGVAHSRATPVVQDFIRIFDPGAEFTSTEAPGAAVARHSGFIRSAGVRVTSDDRGAAEGVARRMSIIQWTPSMNDAALLLKDLSSVEEIVAVSRPNLQPFLPIVSDRQMWVAGLPYTTGYTTASGIATADERLEVVSSFLAAPDNQTALELESAGVRWLWVTPESFDALPRLNAWTELAISDPDVALLRLTGSGANSS